MKESSPQGEKKYSIQYAIGGRNAQFFLTELTKGKLQVLPVAYDTQGKFWYDMAQAGMRHFDDIPEARRAEKPEIEELEAEVE